MNASNAKDYLPLVHALADWKVIQIKCMNGWEDVTAELSLCFAPDQYRIKPEPREIWRNRTADGVEGSVFPTKESAIQALGELYEPVTQIRYREVIE